MHIPHKVGLAMPKTGRVRSRVVLTTGLVTALLLTTGHAAEAAIPISATPTHAFTPAKVQPVAQRPDRVSAALSARLQGGRVLVSGETTESTLTYVNPDGTVTLEASGGPVRVKQGDAWTPIDTTLVAVDGVLRPKASLAKATFSAGGADKPLAKLERSDSEFYALTWPTPLPAPKVEGNKATYPDAAGPGADLVVTALPSGFGHDIVLRERPTGSVEYKIPIEVKGLTLAEAKQGGLKLTDGKGKTVAAAPQPVMYGATPENAQSGRAASDTRQAAPTGAIDTQVIEQDGRPMLVLRPDTKFLADPATTYPVTVDPVSSLTTLGDVTVVSPNGQSGSTTISVGNSDSSNQRNFMRTMLAFNTSAIAGKSVTDARLELQSGGSFDWGCLTGQSVKAQRITSTWDPRTTYWSNQPTTTTEDEKPATEPGKCTSNSAIPAGTWTWPVTDMAKDWASGAPGNGIALRLVTEDPTPYKDQYERSWQAEESAGSGGTPAKLIITYGSTPSVEQLRAAPIVANEGIVYTSSTTPTLFTGVKDPDGGLLRAEFEVEKDPASGSTGQLWAGAVDGITAGDNAKIAVPAGKLTDGSKVRWHARAFDGIDYSAWSSWQLLTIDATAPAAPTTWCPEYDNDTWTARRRPLGDPTECDLSSTSDDRRAFRWGLDDPATPNEAPLKDGTIYYPNGRPIKIDPTDGWHTLYVRTVDVASNTSTLTGYSFGIGAGGLVKSAVGDRTQRWLALITAAAPDRTQARYEYRKAGSSASFTVIPTTDVTVPGSGQPIAAWPQTRTDTSKNFPELAWDLAKTLRDAQIADGAIEVRACLPASAGETCAEPVKTTLDQSAFGGSYATTDVGPGTVALQSGDYSITATDADLFGITVARTHASLTPGPDRLDEQLAENKVFGPGWRAGFPSAPSDIADFVPTSAGESGSLQLVGADGTTLSYVKNGTGFSGVGDTADGSIVTATSEELTVTTPAGSKTTYTKANNTWVVSRTQTAAAESTVTYLRDTQGRITRILAPTPTGLTCGPTLVAGCRALELSYAPTTTATGVASGWGDFKDQVKSVSLTAFDPDSNAMKTTVLASYAYDTTGHLRQVTDPRTTLATIYYYNGEGRASQLTPPGLAPWRFEYDAKGRLANVQREGGDIDPTQAVAYDVPIGGTGAPIDLTAAQTAKWGQATDLPIVGTATFPASHVPARGSDGSYNPAAADWEYADITHTDVNGRAVNNTSYGAGAWQIGTARYDDKGNTVWKLTPGNRAQALTPSADTDPYVAARRDSAERANLLATISTYNSDSDPLTVDAPALQAQLADGTLVSARRHTSTVYDEGKPSNAINYHLATTTKVEPVVLDGTASPATADTKTTKTGYDPIKSGDASGWDLRQPTNSVTVMSGATDIVRKARYDASGREIERRQPASNGSDAGTTATTYFTAGAHPSLAACGNKPQWAGLACQRAPLSQPTGKPLPVTLVTYGYYGGPTSSVDTAGSTVRTTTSTYDVAGRPFKSKIIASPAADGGTPLPETTVSYDPATGLRASLTDGTNTLTNTYDSFGRRASTKDADGNTTTVSYTIDGQLASLSDAKGNTTYTYDGTDAAGRTERRGLPTAITSGKTGTFTAAYTADGQLAVQTYPNSLTATSNYDNAGFQTGLSYAKAGTPWLVFHNVSDVTGRVVQSGDTRGAGQRYSYDAAGRLVKTTDIDSGTCTTRQYTLDPNSNRTNLDTFPADASGACSTSTSPVTKASTFDGADRITNSGYAYDALGRTTTVPAADVAGGANLTVTYHVNDMAASLTQNSTTKTYGLDPASRVRTITTTTQGGSPGTIVNHYADDSDNPSWIAEADGSWTRNITGFDGIAAMERSDGTSQVKLTNLHGDIIASCDNTSNGAITAYYDTTEYGEHRPGSDDPGRYGWLGSHQRSTGDGTGGIILMGSRLYNPATGRFLQVDPIPGGSDNPYEYAAQDPINNVDLAGTKKKKKVPTLTASDVRVKFIGGSFYIRLSPRAVRAIAQAGVWGTAGMIAEAACTKVKSSYGKLGCLGAVGAVAGYVSSIVSDEYQPGASLVFKVTGRLVRNPTVSVGMPSQPWILVWDVSHSWSSTRSTNVVW
ncbi:RHS repeat-associated core domain-containing protein [Nonomuraea sp. NEAU-A123]|uniref:RHS repeat-associated core domain-containing protein n=1 Tax=Nonomuraea sp. NEAU-A123 TaxID=2839649 RepID=UPI001BE4A4A5|nr:RHS repeat-associated core domain-containing protein [Nonomuraea sp. NEAU-A123]MBT2231221.1 hypothetical protein [Nonomuraea sp. NEAU-A123]